MWCGHVADEGLDREEESSYAGRGSLLGTLGALSAGVVVEEDVATWLGGAVLDGSDTME